MTIVAFLQNMWVRDPGKVRAMIHRRLLADGEKAATDLRRRLQAYALFAGCVTGRRLKAAFGQEWCDRIIWEESTLEICGDPKTIPAPQPEHIRAVLAELRPTAIVTFGAVAHAAVAPIWLGGLLHGSQDFLFKCPHPAARQPGVMEEMKGAAKMLEGLRHHGPPA